MTTTLITNPATDRSRLLAQRPVGAPAVAACSHRPTASVVFASPMFVAPTGTGSTCTGASATDSTNLWLGGASVGASSEYGTKRIVPGRLDGMT